MSCIWGLFKCATMQKSWCDLDRSNAGVIFYWVFMLQIYFYDVFSALLVHKTHSKSCVEESCIRGKNLLLVWARTLFNDSEDVMSSPCISLEKVTSLPLRGKNLGSTNKTERVSWNELKSASASAKHPLWDPQHLTLHQSKYFHVAP